MTSSASAAQRLAGVWDRIERACRRSDRTPDEITLVAVSKKQPLGSIEPVLAAGHRVLGESQVQEAERKAASLTGVEWHLVGPLQSNKARRAARLFDVIHSVDRLKIARMLDREAAKLERRLDVFLQLNLGGEQSKHGFSPDSFQEDLLPLAGMASIRPIGLMCIPPLEPEREGARKWFRSLRRIRDQTKEALPGFPGKLSMGMSRDFEIAIEEGATHVRVGTEIFGPRPA